MQISRWWLMLAMLVPLVAQAEDPMAAIQGRWASAEGSTVEVSGSTAKLVSRGSGETGITRFVLEGDTLFEGIHFVREDRAAGEHSILYQASLCKGRRYTPSGIKMGCSLVLDFHSNQRDIKPTLNDTDDCCLSFTSAGRSAGAAQPQLKPPVHVPTVDDDNEYCSDKDIEGNWSRSDGASIVLNGMGLKDGGRALMFNHPQGWPAGVFKFSDIHHQSGCIYAAVCQTLHRNAAGGGYNITEEKCTLTVDKAKKTLTAPGGHGTFRR